MEYSFQIYEWNLILLKDINIWIRNFVWTGDVNKAGLVSVKWNPSCSSKQDGGLQVLNLQVENKAYLLLLWLAWDFTYSNMPWSIIMP